MNDKTAELIESLASKLGTTAEYLWGVLIKQAAISSASNIITVAILIIAVVIYTKWLSAKLKDEDVDWDYGIGVQMCAIFGGIMSLCAVGISLKLIKAAVTGFMNPEYWALQQILEKL